MGYNTSSKGKEDIFHRLSSKGARYTIGQNKFTEKNLYYPKKGLENGIINNENILKTQSNLIYFLDYLKNVLKVKFNQSF